MTLNIIAILIGWMLCVWERHENKVIWATPWKGVLGWVIIIVANIGILVKLCW